MADLQNTPTNPTTVDPRLISQLLAQATSQNPDVTRHPAEPSNALQEAPGGTAFSIPSLTPPASEAPRPNWLQRHPFVEGLGNMAVEGLRAYGEGIEDPRMTMHREDISSRMALALAQMQALSAFRGATLGERGRHDVATENIGQENATTRQIGTLGRLGISQTHQDWLENKVTSTKSIPDDKSPTGASLVMLDAEGNEVGRLTGFPPSAMMPTVRTSTTEHITRDPISGAILSTPATSTSTSQKVLPGQAQGVAAPVTPSTKPTVKPGPGAPQGPTNKTKQVGQAAFPLTSTTRTMIEAAPSVKGFTSAFREMLDQFDRAGVALGPVQSRWHDFIQGTVGVNDPLFAGLRVDKNLLSTLLMRMHAGARGGVLLIPHFEEMFDITKSAPGNIRASLDGVDAYADRLIAEGQGALQGKAPWQAPGVQGSAGPPAGAKVRVYNPATGKLE